MAFSIKLVNGTRKIPTSVNLGSYEFKWELLFANSWQVQLLIFASIRIFDIENVIQIVVRSVGNSQFN